MTAHPSTTVAVLSYSQPARLAALVARMREQTVVPDEVLIVWSSATPLVLPLESMTGVRVLAIPPAEFGHGRTRNLALRSTATQILVLITDDASPADDQWLAELLRPFVERPRVGAVFGRQVVADARSAEAVFRRARYPTSSFPIRLDPGRVFDLERTPASNANAAYCASALRAVGGFREDLVSGEDNAATVTLLDAHHDVWYACDSRVMHTHSYGFIGQVQRTFDMATGHRQLRRRYGLRVSRASGYGSLLWSMVRTSTSLSWRSRLGLATDIAARVVGVMIARLSPALPRAVRRRVSRQRWFYATRGPGTTRDPLT